MYCMERIIVRDDNVVHGPLFAKQGLVPLVLYLSVHSSISSSGMVIGSKADTGGEGRKEVTNLSKM